LVKMACCRVDDFTSASMAKLAFHQFILGCSRVFTPDSERVRSNAHTLLRGWSQIIIIYNTYCDLIRLYASIRIHINISVYTYTYTHLSNFMRALVRRRPSHEIQ
jgi:hypothetical protein